MRDLANLPIGSSSRTRRYKRIILVIFLLGNVGFLGYFFLLNRGIESGGRGLVLQEAPRGLKPVDVAGANLDVEGGVDLATESASMQDVKYGGEARATVTRSFGGGTYILSVEAQLPDPKNTNYQVWLVGAAGPLPIDYMRGTGTSWSLSLRDQDKYSKYNGIWITLERTKDAIAEEHVMEGSF